MKKYFLGVLTGFIVCTMFVSTFAIANSPIKLIVNGKLVESDVPPQIINGRTMIPARPLAEALGADVRWDEENSAVVVTGGVQVGVVPTDLDNMPINPMAGKNALWREGFTINGKSIETDGTIDDPGIHAMGFVTPDNFYLEEEILNNILSDMGSPTVKHKCPSPDVKYNAWFFISLKDISDLIFVYDDERNNLVISTKTDPQELISKANLENNRKDIKEILPKEWIDAREISGKNGIVVTMDDERKKFYIRYGGYNTSVDYALFPNDGSALTINIFGEDVEVKMIENTVYLKTKE